MNKETLRPASLLSNLYPPVSCTVVKKKFYELSEGELHGGLQARVASHLTKCSTCSRDWDLYTYAVKLAPSLRVQDYSMDNSARTRIRMKLNQELGLSLNCS